MNPLLLSIALAVGQPPAAGDRPAADRDRAPAAENAPRIDGSWTVVAFERGGQNVPVARGATATVRDNTITFAAAPGTGTTGGRTGGTASDTGTGPTSRASESGPTVGPSLRPIRLDFGPNGTVRVTEIDADRPAGTGTGTAARGVRSGVYIMTRDFLAVSVLDETGPTVGGPGGGTNTKVLDPGTGRATTADPVPGGGGGNRAKGDRGTGGTPTTGGTGGTPGGGGTEDRASGAGRPDRARGTEGAPAAGRAGAPAPSYMTVILQRTGSDTGTGTGGTRGTDR